MEVVRVPSANTRAQAAVWVYMEQVQTEQQGVRAKAAVVALEAQMVATGQVLWVVALAVAVAVEL